LKVRKQNATPCLKKGIDNYKVSNLCELSSHCKNCDAFKNQNSNTFKFCQEVESYLVDNQLIRYEMREMTGLEVLFDGIEKIYNLNAEIYNYDHFEGIGPRDLTQLSSSIEFHNSSSLKKDNLSKNEDFLGKNQKIIITESVSTQDSEPSILNHLPENLGLAQSFGYDLLSCPPDNIFDSVFQSLYQQGVFEPKFAEIKGETKEERLKRELKDDDFSTVATIMFHGLEDRKLIKSFWPRYTDSRFEKNKNKVYATVNIKMHKYLKRFSKIWNLLTDNQVDALNAEWFYEELEKPTQEQLAKNLGITVSSYQERLELAYKKLQKLYPDLDRIRRRKLRSSPEAKLVHPEKKLSPQERAKIKNWAKEKMEIYLNSLKRYSQDYVIVETEDKANANSDTTQSVENDHQRLS